MLPTDGPQIFIKRDDLTGMELSGNKIRKLEFILAAAKAAGHDSVITLGGAQSNHARATAVAASLCGLQTHLILRTSRALVDRDPGLVGNLLVERLIGAHIHLVTKEEYSGQGQAALGAALLTQLQAEGLNPVLIPVGGSSALGTWGYISAMAELKQQMQLDTTIQFTDIVMACGSGGTTAGIALGNHLSGLRVRVTGYMVCDDEEYFENYLNGLFQELGATTERIGASAADLVRFVQAKGAGYALSRPEELQTLQRVAEATAIVLDPVYTGKAMHALLQEIYNDPEAWRGRKVLFVHTGGLLGLYDAVPQLQPLVEATGRVHRLKM